MRALPILEKIFRNSGRGETFSKQKKKKKKVGKIFVSVLSPETQISPK